MSINQKQYQQLTEMGISLWQHRPEAFQDIVSSQNNLESSTRYLQQNIESLAALSKQTFFTDILLALELSIGEVTAQKDHLDLGLFNWFFYAEQDKTSSIDYADNKLITPSIESIRQSHALKKQLWQTITTKLL
ncbi:MAG: DNA polymerase III subunit psi [Colwellia sp.]|nr:DNA polymerase III subunit psi [Colwellia sp.]